MRASGHDRLSPLTRQPPARPMMRSDSRLYTRCRWHRRSCARWSDTYTAEYIALTQLQAWQPRTLSGRLRPGEIGRQVEEPGHDR
jgi:hypothetical protein